MLYIYREDLKWVIKTQPFLNIYVKSWLTMKKTMRINKRICGRKNSSNTVSVLMKPQMN